ncbi:hypothetical protein M9458_029283, partial [Cirrhinus mrigala]
MKNPHLNGHCKILHSVSGDKRVKRKSREPIKRVSDDHLPYFKLQYKDAHLMAETDGCAKVTRGSEIIASRDDSVLNTAVDMRINTVIAGETPGASEKTVSGRSAQAQVFPLERALSQRAASQAPGESAESPRKRAGEPSGVVTEIKAIQQTRRLLANARERTRVHTISAAFEALRKQ